MSAVQSIAPLEGGTAHETRELSREPLRALALLSGRKPISRTPERGASVIASRVGLPVSCTARCMPTYALWEMARSPDDFVTRSRALFVASVGPIGLQSD